jgi:predicted ribosomally synthesized peptide with SipW-like signal peptide
MRKQLTAFMSLFVIGAFITSGSYAYFTSTTTSSGNIFSTATAPILELGSDTQSYYSYPADSVLMTVSNLLPGVETGVYHIYYRNAGSINGVVTIDIDENDNNLASKIWITQGTLDGSPSIAPYWARQIAEQTGDGTWATAVASGYIAYYPSAVPYPYLPTLYGIAQITLHFSTGYLATDWVWIPGESHTTGLNFMLDPNAGNNYAGISVTAAFYGTITQAV